MELKLKRSTKAFGLLVVLIAAGATYLWHRPSPEAKALDDIAETIVPTTLENAGATSPQAARAPYRNDDNKQHPALELAVGDPLYPMADEAAIEWLRRNGYPSMLEFQATNGRRPSLRDVNLQDGISAEELLDLELIAAIDEGERKEAIAQLNKAAAMGSMYALEVLGRVHASRKNYVWSEAYFRASQIRGNWAIEMRMKPRLTAGEQIFASIMAQQIIDSANIARQRQGLGPLAHDSRPGAEDALVALRTQIAIERQQQTGRGN
jgi:hypothetical protein